MTNRLPTKVRLVKCPKCSKILPEPEQVPLYTCGGCGTILQAKYYRVENRASGLDSHEQVAAESNGIVKARDGGESGSSSQRSSSAGDQSSDRNQVQDHNVAEGKSEQLGGANSDHFTALSEESGFLMVKGDGEVDSKSHVSNSKDHVVNQIVQHPRAANSANEASFTESATVLETKAQKCIAHANSSKEASRLCSSQVLESKELSTLGQDHAPHENREAQHITRVNGVTENENEQLEHPHVIPSDDQKQVGDVNSFSQACILNDSPGTKETVRNGLDNHILVKNRKDDCEGKLSYEKISAEDINYHDMKKIPNLAKEESNGEAQHDSIECIQEPLGSIKLSEPSMPTEIMLCRNDNLTACREANSRASRDTVKMDSCNVSQESHSGTNSLKNVSETLRQKIEDFDDGFEYGSEIVRSVDSPKASEPVNAPREDGRSRKTVQRSLTRGSLAYDGSVSSFDGNDDQGIEQQEHANKASPELKNLVSRGGYSESGFQGKAKTSSKMLLDEKMKSGTLEEAELVEDNAIPGRNRPRPYRDGLIHRVPLYRSSELVYETGSSSSYIHEELPIHRMHHYPCTYEDSEAWVKKGYVQKQNIDRRRFPEALWRESEFVPTYYNYETSGEIYQRSRHPGYVDRRRRAESWSLSGSLPRVQYSGEIFNGRYQMRDPFMNRRPDDIRWSAQLPPPSAFCWDAYDSCPTSPRQFMEPEPYPWTRDAASVSDDQRLRDQIMRRLHIREKRQAVKRHCHPLAGGAPFITCYFCFRVVQLPEEFLLSRRRTTTHRVKCGACLSILKFALENETCLTPHVLDEATEGSETNAERYGSTETRSKNSSNEEKLEEFHRAGSRSRSRQTKVMWQLPSRRSKSPLHRLMGYSSPHDMFNGREGGDVDW